MPTIDYKPLATGAGANVLDQADFAAASWLSTGFLAGIAKSAYVNKVLRQSSVMATVLATFISNETGNDMLDDGNVSAAVAQLVSAVQMLFPVRFGRDVSGAGNSVNITSININAPFDGLVVMWIQKNTDGTGAHSISIGSGSSLTLKYQGATPPAGTLIANHAYAAVWDATQSFYHLISPPG